MAQPALPASPMQGLHTMVKPLAGGTLGDCLWLVPRERPDEACAAPEALRAG